MIQRYFLGLAAALIAATAVVPAKSQDIPPFFLTNNNAGKEFYFSFPPAYSQGWGSGEIKIYISSFVATDVLVEIVSEGWVRNLKVEPNKVTELTIPSASAQPYFKTSFGATASDQIYSQKAIHVKADDPVVVYGATLFQTYTDAFMFLPTSGIGQNYIVSSYMEAPGFSGSNSYPGEVIVAAPYDGTQVTFTLGGNLSTKTNGNGQGANGLTPGQSKKYTMKKGDVLLISTYGNGGDISGSTISSNKPVSVITGQFCTKIPANVGGFGWCNYLGEAELPTSAWGTMCHVTKLHGRTKNSYIKVVAKEPNTKIYRNGQLIGTLQTAGGTDGQGYLDMRVAEGEVRSVVISADKPISVMQYNTSKGDDGVNQGEPFQMVMTPVEQYQKDIFFSTPGSGTSNGFPSHYLNIVFELDAEGTIPEDLMIGIEDKGEIKWQGVEEQFGAVFEAIPHETAGKMYGVKTIKLAKEGVYRLKAAQPVGGYLYNAGNDPYGCPASAGLVDRTFNDTDAPRPTYTMDNFGTVENAKVRDLPEDGSRRSNLATVYLAKHLSTNYRLTTGQFVPGQSNEVTWGLTVIDPTEPATAVVVFIDRAGNDTTITVEFEGVKTAAVEVIDHDFGGVTLSNSKEGSVRITSTGNKAVTITSVEVPTSAAFTVEDIPAVPFTLEPESFQNLKVRFAPTTPGPVSGNIVFRMSDLSAAAATIQGEGVAPMLKAMAVNFPETEVETSKAMQLQVLNEGTDKVSITSIREPSTGVFSMTMPTLPLDINPGESFTTTVQFNPTGVGEFSDEVRLYVLDYEVQSELHGVGITTSTVSVGEPDAALPVEIYPNPADNAMTVSYSLPQTMHVRIALYNAFGAEVQVLADGVQERGAQTLMIAADALPAGVYFCRLTAGGITSTIAVSIVR